MTDMSTSAPPTKRLSRWQRLGIQARRPAALLASIPALFIDAFRMAYVEPYSSHRRRPQVLPDEDLEGRDPRW